MPATALYLWHKRLAGLLAVISAATVAQGEYRDAFVLGDATFRCGLGVSAIDYSPDGKWLAASDASTVRIFDAATGSEQFRVSAGWVDPLKSMPLFYKQHPQAMPALAMRPPLLNAITSMAFSPDGKFLAIGFQDLTVSIVLIDSGKVTKVLPPGERTEEEEWSGAGAIAFSNDGRRLFIASRTPSVRVWDTTVWTSLVRIETHLGSVAHIAVRPRSAEIAFVGGPWDGTERRSPGGMVAPADELIAEVWDLRRNATRFQVRSGQAQVFHGKPLAPERIQYLDSGTVFATFAGYAEVDIWDAETGANSGISFPAQNDEERYEPFAFSADGRLMAVNNYEVRITARNSPAILSRNESEYRLDRFLVPQRSEMKLEDMAFSPDGRNLAVATNHKVVKTWAVQDGADQFPGIEQVSAVAALHWSHDGRQLLAAHDTGPVQKWDVAGRKRLDQLTSGDVPERPEINGMHVLPDQSILTWSDLSAPLHIWRQGSQRTIEIPEGVVIDTVAVRHDGVRNSTDVLVNRTPLCSKDAPYVYQVDLEKWRFDPVTAWSARKPRRLRSVPGTTEFVWIEDRDSTEIETGPDVRQGGRDNYMGDRGRIGFGDPNSPAKVREVDAHSGRIIELVISADGKTAVSAGADQQWTLWDVPSRKPLVSRHIPNRENRGNGNALLVAVSDDGAIVVTVNSSGINFGDEALLWDRDGNLLQRIDVFQDPIGLCDTIRFSPDNSFLAIGQLNGLIRVLSRE